MSRVSFAPLVILVLFWLTVSPAVAQRVSNEERQIVKLIKSQLDSAGKLFRAKKIEESAAAYTTAREQLSQAAAGARPALAKLLKTEYARLSKAHQLLTEAGQSLDTLPDFNEWLETDVATISFQKDVAPILVSKCGNCHVNQSRGRFSAATFEALEGSTKIAFGIPHDSRLIQVIESGEMPKGGLTVEPAELETLKSWIRQGAKFDGENRTQNLNQLVGGDQPAMQPESVAAKPTGKETVSFGLQVAPILVENCARCHMANNPQGNFYQATFESFLRGGDSGSPIKPGDSAASLLYRRIAAGEMPPSGKLPQASIDLIKIWIDEGAKFDGLDVKTTMINLAKTAKANSQSHADLLADRKKLANGHFELVMGKSEPIQVESDNFHVFSASDEARVSEISQRLEKMTTKLAAFLKANASPPLIKGNTSVFVFDKRYDFSEFGKMVSRQELAKEQTSHWDFTVTDSFASVLLTKNQTAEDAELDLAQQVAAIYIASLATDVPRWFADGTGYWAASKYLSKREQVGTWETAALEAAASVKSPADFLEGRLTQREAGLVGFQVVKALKKKSRAFDQLIARMQQGESFEKSFEEAYGAMLSVYLTRGW